MKTVFNKKETTKKITVPFPYNIKESDTITFEIQGQTPERAIEDRSVYIKIETIQKKTDGCISVPINGTMWLDSENAIELGLMLIEAGNFAFEANMINHQRIWSIHRLKQFINEKRIVELSVAIINNNPVNYGKNFHTVKITPKWAKNMSPKYMEDFNFDEVIYFDSDKALIKKIKEKYNFNKIKIEKYIGA